LPKRREREKEGRGVGCRSVQHIKQQAVGDHAMLPVGQMQGSGTVGHGGGEGLHPQGLNCRTAASCVRRSTGPGETHARWEIGSPRQELAQSEPPARADGDGSPGRHHARGGGQRDPGTLRVCGREPGQRQVVLFVERRERRARVVQKRRNRLGLWSHGRRADHTSQQTTRAQKRSVRRSHTSNRAKNRRGRSDHMLVSTIKRRNCAHCHHDARVHGNPIG